MNLPFLLPYWGIILNDILMQYWFMKVYVYFVYNVLNDYIGIAPHTFPASSSCQL